MIAIILVSGFFLPPILFCLLYYNITEQERVGLVWDEAKNTAVNIIRIQSKEDAQAEVRRDLLKTPWFWLWCAYAGLVLLVLCIGLSGAAS